MTLGFRFHPETQAELFADVEWYDDREPGLGRRFGSAVRAAVAEVADSPQSWACASDLVLTSRHDPSSPTSNQSGPNPEPVPYSSPTTPRITPVTSAVTSTGASPPMSTAVEVL